MTHRVYAGVIEPGDCYSFRELFGITHQELAERAKLPEITVLNFELGNVPLSKEEMSALMRAIGKYAEENPELFHDVNLIDHDNSLTWEEYSERVIKMPSIPLTGNKKMKVEHHDIEWWAKGLFGHAAVFRHRWEELKRAKSYDPVKDADSVVVSTYPKGREWRGDSELTYRYLVIREIGWWLHANGGVDLMRKVCDEVYKQGYAYGSCVSQNWDDIGVNHDKWVA